MRLAGGFNAAVHLFAKRRRCYDSVAGGCKHAALFGAAADYRQSRSNTDSAGHRLGRRLRRFWFTFRKQL